VQGDALCGGRVMLSDVCAQRRKQNENGNCKIKCALTG
jgi:hypothetical protein